MYCGCSCYQRQCIYGSRIDWMISTCWFMVELLKKSQNEYFIIAKWNKQTKLGGVFVVNFNSKVDGKWVIEDELKIWIIASFRFGKIITL